MALCLSSDWELGKIWETERRRCLGNSWKVKVGLSDVVQRALLGSESEIKAGWFHQQEQEEDQEEEEEQEDEEEEDEEEEDEEEKDEEEK